MAAGAGINLTWQPPFFTNQSGVINGYVYMSEVQLDQF
jgi:hypothetical protein